MEHTRRRRLFTTAQCRGKVTTTTILMGRPRLEGHRLMLRGTVLLLLLVLLLLVLVLLELLLLLLLQDVSMVVVSLLCRRGLQLPHRLLQLLRLVVVGHASLMDG